MFIDAAYCFYDNLKEFLMFVLSYAAHKKDNNSIAIIRLHFTAPMAGPLKFKSNRHQGYFNKILPFMMKV